MRLHADLARLALLMVAAAGARAADWPQVPEPDGAQSEWVSKDMVYNGLPMRTSRFTSGQSVQQLVDFYNRQWPGQTVVNEVGGKTVVGHPQGNHFVTVEIESKAGGSQAQVGIMEMPKDKPAKAPGDGFLKPMGTQVVNDISYLDNPGRTLALESTLSPYQSESFYRSRLPATGWRLDEGAAPCSMIATSCVTRYSKGKQEMTMTFSRHEEGTSIVVNQTQH